MSAVKTVRLDAGQVVTEVFNVATTDGGRTWTLMGLEQTGRIPRLVIGENRTFYGGEDYLRASGVPYDVRNFEPYLAYNDLKWDIVEVAAVEISLIFFLIAIVTGSIWARPAWNTWWTWDPRLTTAAVTELIYIAYFMLRQGIDDPDRRARFGARGRSHARLRARRDRHRPTRDRVASTSGSGAGPASGASRGTRTTPRSSASPPPPRARCCARARRSASRRSRRGGAGRW